MKRIEGENLFASQNEDEVMTQIEDFSQSQPKKDEPFTQIEDFTQDDPEKIEEFSQTQKDVINLVSQPKEVVDLITQEQTQPSEPPPPPVQSPQKKPPPSGYMLFCRSLRHIVVSENPEARMGQVAKILGKRWKELTDKERQEYNDHCARLKREWGARHQEESSDTPPEESNEPEYEEPPPEIKAKIPQKPGISGYSIWANKTRTRVMQELRGKPVGVIAKELSSRWKEVSEEEKQKYKDLHAKQKQEYELFWQENPEYAKYKPRKKKKTTIIGDPNKLQLPLKRVQNMIKCDPNVQKVKKSAALAIGKAMELFLVKHAKEALYCAKKGGRKTVHEKDVATAIYRNEELDFLRAEFELPTSSIKRPASAKKANAKSRKKQKKLDFEHRKIDSFFTRKAVENVA